ncbi:hypothetical protein K0M31_005613 [Melipona bicolor]|uniref:Uncharacterized protein n=1 Tax=Melipona bicolor TaxID=60889 RepID=A0AA40FUR0_9HYME|nr:hypothetical protein K0M31_005613 [Melipona bicolor]
MAHTRNWPGGQQNRGESVEEGADLKPLSPGENLWSDYGTFFLPWGFALVVFFSPPFSFSTSTRSGGRPSPRQREAKASLCRAESPKRTPITAEIITGIVAKCSIPLAT